MKFEEYFSFEAIVGDLVKWRVAGKDVGGTLPARKAWSRAGAKERKGVASDVVRKQAIWRTVRRACGDVWECCQCGNGGECCQCGNVASANVASCQLRWVQNLMRLVEEVQGAVFSGKVAFEAPTMFKIAKGREGGVMQYREVASFERLADRVILSRMTAYVRDRLEGVLGDCCYSFRRDSSMSHQLAIARLQEWRQAMTARPESAPWRHQCSWLSATLRSFSTASRTRWCVGGGGMSGLRTRRGRCWRRIWGCMR